MFKMCHKLGMLRVWNMAMLLAKLMSLVIARLVPESSIFPEDIGKFCADVDICPERVLDRNYSNPWASPLMAFCCKACSCDDACVQTNNCCFPAREKDLYPESECLFPTTRNLTDLAASYMPYRMVVRNANKNNLQHQLASCSINITAEPPCTEAVFPPFGSLLPVYSKKQNKIFKNPACANSHGVTDGSIWTANLVCIKFGGPQTVSQIQALEYGIILKTCYVDFVYSGNQNDLKLHSCPRGLRRTCPREPFSISDKFNLTQAQTRELCESGLVSPAYFPKRAFANVFCYLCDQGYDFFEKTTKVCIDTVQKRSSIWSFALVMNIDRLYTWGPKAAVPIPEACDESLVDKNTRICRELKCPMARIRDGNGDCNLITHNEDVSRYMIVLEVTVTGLKPSSNYSLRQDLEVLVALWNKVTPWSKQEGIFCILNMNNSDAVEIRSLFVEVVVKSDQNKPFKHLLENVYSFLDMSWHLEINGSVIELHQSFSAFASFFEMEEQMHGYSLAVPSTYHRMNKTDLIALNITVPLILTLRPEFYLDIEMHINKLYYCEQIELRPEEFTIYTSSKAILPLGDALFNKRTQKLMLENEFWLVVQPSGETLARVCLSDSGFKKAPHNSSGEARRGFSTFVMAILSWISLSICSITSKIG